ADHEIELDVLDVAQGIDRADVRNRIVFKRAENVNERVHLAQMADVGRLFQRVLADGADVYILDRGVGQLLRLIERGQLVEPLVGHLGDADVRLAWVCKRVLGKIHLRQYAKQRCLADLRQTDDASFHGESALSYQFSQKNKSSWSIRGGAT